MKTTSSRLGAICVAFAAAGSAMAAPPPGQLADEKSPAKRATAHRGLDAVVSSVTVTVSKATPHVQSTFPGAGGKVAPGLLVLRVTYDIRMRPDGWAFARETGLDYPDCGPTPRLLDDGRTFVVICRTLPSKRYAIWFNRPPLQDFASLSRRPAGAYELKFATTDDDPVRTLPEAMKADPALSNVANPVEPDGLAVYGQPHEPPGN